MIKKMVIMALCIFGMTLFTSGCKSNNSSQGTVSKKLNIDKNQIKEINISAFPERFKETDITDSNQISDVIDYLTSIKPVTTKKNPAEYHGGGYLIKIQFKDKSERVFNHVGNLFFMEKGKFTYEMQYEEAAKIDTIVANILESNMEKYGESSIIGIIMTINSETSGKNVSCVIKDLDNVTHDVSLRDASIIDSTGHGSMILHEKDGVKIYYQKDKQEVKNSILASTVFIKKTEN